MKTAVELTCGTVRGQLVAKPLACLHVTREIVLEHERSEQRAYRRYTIMTYAALLPAGIAAVLGALAFFGAKRRVRDAKRSAA